MHNGFLAYYETGDSFIIVSQRLFRQHYNIRRGDSSEVFIIVLHRKKLKDSSMQFVMK